MEAAMRLSVKAVLVSAALLSVAPPAHAAADNAQQATLRVCAQSDNFPLSDRKQQGFENKLAELVAAKMGRSLAYTWWPARENFIASTLIRGKCDVVMDAPTGLDEIATTRPYYRGTYVFVSRKASHLALSGIGDPKLRQLRIGVYLIGDEQTPPAMALSEEGINDNVVGFMTFFDRSAEGHSELISTVADGKLDVAAVWGPLVGYYVRHSSVPLTITPLNGAFRRLPFQYDIAMGVRKGDERLRDALDQVIAANGPAIGRLLESYGVPSVSITQHAAMPIAASADVWRRP
jgi:quinoprotein dehydrogenase-associated probable ABC transporter substrate-binding protein